MLDKIDTLEEKLRGREKVDLNKAYETRMGLEVEIFTIKEGQEHCVLGAYLNVGGEWELQSWTINGLYFNGEENPQDLVEVRPKRVLWINEHEDDTLWICKSREAAEKKVRQDRIALHRVVLDDDTRIEDD